jgi:hypothetical protein
MKFPLKVLDSLAGSHKRVLVFDCEFWHILNEDKMFKNLKGEEFFFIPREIGGFFLEKSGSEWKLDTPFFVTLDHPQQDTVLPVSHYSTVTPQTGWKLDQIEKRLGLPWGKAFYSRLSAEGKEAYNEGFKAYADDKNIKEHHKPNSWYKSFLKKYADSVIVVKGTGDIDALKSVCQLYSYTYKDPVDVIDISEWNSESNKVCGTAKLAGTFNCIKKDLDEETKALAEHLPLQKAHDPTTDASMTLLVALYIESQKPV